MLGYTEEAIFELECALESDPLSLDVRFWLVIVLFTGRQHERGLEYARQMVSMAPAHNIAYTVLGLVYLGMQKFTDSIDALLTG